MLARHYSAWIAACLLLGCATAPVPREAGFEAAAHDPWAALAAGDFRSARAGFEQLRATSGREQEGLAGLLSLAQTTADDPAVLKLLESADPASASGLLAVTAAEAALDLRPLPPRSRDLAARACAFKADAKLGDRAKSACSWLPLVSNRSALERCTAGCSASTRLGMFFAGNQPVVLASVNGLAEAAFIVDTGASTSVLTRSFAAQAKVEMLPGTELEAQAAGGTIATGRALVSFKTGAVTVEDVPVALIDLPIDSIAGIIAPQATWRQFAVDLDFHSFAAVLSPSPAAGPALIAVPYLRHESRPALLLETAGRPPRPIVLDTGAFHTTLDADWEALGPPLEHVRETRAAGAGGQGSRGWITRAEVAARAGEFSWTMHNPSILEGKHQSEGPLRSVGLLGMDLMMGRHLVLDVPRRKMWLSGTAALPDWPVGSSTVWRIKMEGLAAPVLVTEKLVERSGESVTLEISYSHPQGDRHFRLQMPETWDTRGTWLIGRPATKLWDLSGGQPKELDPKQAAGFWLPVFFSFKTVAAKTSPRIRFDMVDLGGQKTACTTIVLPAEAAKAAAELAMTSCPSDPWRTRHLTLTDSDGRVLWDVDRKQ
ncbi:MAG: aspartyl protease family protein [Deltaproteobacteria bacterium]|nr:aspartyl protease family protein [Deltaproteobacteria bacterium]